MKKLSIIVIFTTLVIGLASVYYSRSQNPATVPWLYHPDQTLHPGATKADVRQFCKFLTVHQASFDKYTSKGVDVEAEVTIEGVKYELTYQPSSFMLDLVVTDGGEIVAIRDFSTDGTVDWFSRAEYSYLHFQYEPQGRPKDKEQFTHEMDQANRDYEKYLLKLMRHFNLHIEGSEPV